MIKKTSNQSVSKPDYTICFIFVLVVASEYVVERFILQYFIFLSLYIYFQTSDVKKKLPAHFYLPWRCRFSNGAGNFQKAVLNVLQG